VSREAIRHMAESSKALKLAVWGAVGAAAAFIPGEFVQAVSPEPDSIVGLLFNTSVWTAVVAAGYTAALIIAQNKYLRRPLMDAREATLAFGGGAVFGAISGCVAQFFFSIATRMSGGNWLVGAGSRVIAWGILGGLIGLGMAFVIPNLGKARGMMAGLAGGAVGGVGFMLSAIVVVVAIGIAGAILGGGDASILMLLGDPIARLVGTSILGVALGYAIGLVEETARVAWLEVRHGRSGEMVKVSLGPELVCVGNNSQRCAIWAQGARPIALRFRYVDGKVICDDMAQERTSVVEPGYEVQVGSVHLVVRGGAAVGVAGSQHGVPASTPAPQAPPRPAPPPPPRPAAGRSAVNGVPSPSGGVPIAPAKQPAFPSRSAGGRPPPPPPPPPPRR
jgi:hypothetical protein